MLDVSVFSGLRDTSPKRQTWTADDLYQWAREPRRGAKDSAPLWSPALYPPGATRAARHVAEVTALVLDFDGGAPWHHEHIGMEPEAAPCGLDPWRRYAHVAHTSHSHAPALHELDVWRHCYRVVVPLEVPIPARDFMRLWRWAYALSPGADPQCKDSSRVYFQPVTGDSILRYWYEVVGGEILDWRTLDLPAEPEPVRRQAPTIVTTHLSPTQLQRIEWYRLEHDSAARERWVLDHGGEVVDRPSGRVGHKMTCPKCGQPGLVLVIDYDRKRRAWCEHENSCGFDDYPWRM